MEVYLDNSATTRPSDAVVTAMSAAMAQHWHNPSALYRPAMAVEKLVDAARTACLDAAGAQGQRMIFTSGGTEANNLAIFGHMRRMRRPGKVLLLSVEHPAVLACQEELRHMGHQVELLRVDSHGVLDLQHLESLLDESVHLICVMQVNNETGAIQPLGEVVRLRNAICPQAAIHVDGVQGFLRLPLHFNSLGIQSYAFSGHKIHACKGVGGLIVHKAHRLAPLVYGGGQEDGLRSGTENVPGIVGLGEAVATYPADGAPRMMHLKAHLWQAIKTAIPEAILNGPALEDAACAPHILNVSLPPVRSQTMLFALEGDGVYVSAGSACASRKQKVSGVLTAMGLSNQLADCALRFSLCPDNTEEEMDYAAACVAKHYGMLRKYVRR